MSSPFAPLAIAAALMLSASAQAATPDQILVKVGFTDLDLSSPAGHAALMNRIDQAVNQACAPAPQTLQERLQVRACHAAAREQAMPVANAIIAAAEAKTRMAGEPNQLARTAAK